MSEDAQLLIVVMGVSGSGKTTVGRLVAQKLGLPFVDGDDLHPEANVQRMARGEPLTDDDRWAWLRDIGNTLAAAPHPGLVLACSALKRSYRDAISTRAAGVTYVHLTVPQPILRKRISGRNDHFMPSSLLASQIADLEPLESDENGFTIDVSHRADDVSGLIVERLRNDI